jgi:tetratricopeptide (TPR) repeat protein
MMTRSPIAILIVVVLIVAGGCAGDPVARRDAFVQSGREYFEAERYEEARIQFLNALQADDRYTPARLALAETYQRMGNHQGAVNEYRRVLEQDSGNIEAKLSLGRYYLGAGVRESQWFGEARKLAEEVLEVEPDNIRARLLLGNAFAGLQDFDRSIEALEEALRSDPDNLDAYLNIGASRFGRQQPREAEEAFLEAVRRHPDSVRAHLGLGNFYAFSGDPAKAEEAFRKGFELDRSDQSALLALARLHMSQGLPEQAAAVFEEAIEAAEDPVPLQLALANFRIAQGNAEEGLALLERVRLEHPENRDVTVRLAEIRLNGGQPEQAEQLVDEILAADARDPEARYLKGRILVTREDFEGALAELDRALEAKSYLTAASLIRADVLQRLGRFSEAEETVRGVLALDRGNLQARARLAKFLAVKRGSRPDIENALAEAQAVLEEIPNHPDALSAQAEAFLGLQRLTEAERAYRDLHQASPNNPFYLHRLGTIAALQNRPAEAERYFSQALEVNPNLADVLNDLVVVLLQQDRRGDALLKLDELAARSERQAPFHLLKGRIHLGGGDFGMAEAEFRRAMEVAPESHEPYLLLGQLRLQQGRADDAVKEVDELLERNPNFGPAHLLRAYYRDAAGDTRGAMEGYRRALELFDESNPAYGAAANNLAWLYVMAEENLTEALSLAQRARRLDPNNASYADTLGWAHYRMGNYTLAVDQLLFAVNQGRPQAPHYYRLGMAYFKRGDTLHAKQTLRRALELSQDFDGAEEARRTLAELG